MVVWLDGFKVALCNAEIVNCKSSNRKFSMLHAPCPMPHASFKSVSMHHKLLRCG